MEIGTICFVCEWNEGRSAHLELSVRRRLRRRGLEIQTLSAGLSQGGGINTLRRQFLRERGIPEDEIRDHRSIVFDERCAGDDLILVAELQMKQRLLERWPGIAGRVMTIRGFVAGMTPDTERIPAQEAHIEDSGGHSDSEKMALYEELEKIADSIAARLAGGAAGTSASTVGENHFRQEFGPGHVVLPVVHVATADQAMRNAGVAHEAGAQGVFLINHDSMTMGWRELLKVHEQVTASFPGWWVGVNCLDLGPREVIAHVTSAVSGVWVDDALIIEDRQQQPGAEEVLAERQRRAWSGLYFGGVAFKYQRQVEDYARAAQLATRYMDVVTTSGPATGQAAEVDKIALMKRALGDHPLAIASGITPENVADFMPHADCFLVATGISRSFEELEPSRVKALMDAVNSIDTEPG